MCSCCLRWEVEGFIKILLCIVGICGELATAFNDGHFAYLGNGQHATMFFFFALSGFVDILVHYKVPLPPNIEYFAVILAFIVEGILFKFHLHGRSDLDISIHTLLVIAVFSTVVSFILEVRYKDKVLVALLRAFTVLVQGTWFIQIGFILYNPLPGAQPWNGEDHDMILLGFMLLT